MDVSILSPPTNHKVIACRVFHKPLLVHVLSETWGVGMHMYLRAVGFKHAKMRVSIPLLLYPLLLLVLMRLVTILLLLVMLMLIRLGISSLW